MSILADPVTLAALVVVGAIVLFFQPWRSRAPLTASASPPIETTGLVNVDLAGDLTGIELAIDGTAHPIAQTLTLTLDPGRHEIVASRRGEIVKQHVISLKAGQRLSAEDGLVCLETPDLLALGRMADHVKRGRSGDWVYFVINRYVNPTNLCVLDCAFCDFAKKRGDLPEVVLSIWNRAPSTYSTTAVRQALAARGTTLKLQYARFAAANLAPAKGYSEGGAYYAPVYDGRTALPAKRQTVDGQFTLKHLTYASQRLVPKKVGKGEYERE